MGKEYTRDEIETLLNDKGVPERDKKSNGGNIPDTASYGTWLRKNDAMGFFGLVTAYNNGVFDEN